MTRTPSLSLTPERITIQELRGIWRATYDGPTGAVVAYGASQAEARTALALLIECQQSRSIGRDSARRRE